MLGDSGIKMNYLDRNRNQMMAKYPKFQQYKQGFVVGEDIMEELLKMAGDEKIEFGTMALLV